MKTTPIVAATTLLLALPVTAQSTDSGPKRDQVRKQDGAGSGTASGTKSQLRKHDGSCGNPKPNGTRVAGQGARKGQRR